MDYLRASHVALVVKNPPANAGDSRDAGSNPGSGRSPGGKNSNTLQYSCLKIPWTDEPGRLQSMGSKRVRHYWVTEHAHVHELLKPMVWAILGEAGLMVRLPRSYGVLEETSNARNVTKEEKEGGKYWGISLPPGLQSPANSHPRMEAQKKHGQRVLGGLSVFPVKWRQSTKLGKKGRERRNKS